MTDRLLGACGTIPRRYERFAAATAKATNEQFGTVELEAVLKAWVRWSQPLDAARQARNELRRLRWCESKFWPRIDVGYAVSSRPTANGLAWRTTLTVDNRTRHLLGGLTGGWAKVTHWKAHPHHAGSGKTVRMDWGGSSADFLDAERGTSSRPIGLYLDTHTTKAGTFDVRAIRVGLGWSSRRSCTVPVAERQS